MYWVQFKSPNHVLDDQIRFIISKPCSKSGRVRPRHKNIPLYYHMASYHLSNSPEKSAVHPGTTGGIYTCGFLEESARETGKELRTGTAKL